nr:MAG TPA: hypothetical protein [Caudoviricetes sp.]DAG73514.1 MAG TPA: hypothetical protein [Caudoviricetes sp.]DAG77871.1 MAG TPA: hypothetical protein [Caudoviricetes sp.]DAJ90840.1 MAG TPA: hypothetical protein [Caudoviricetes sp.]DAO39884.1 MAG TPA: hypothetical protein [Caudoviricetes sp.]
MYRYNKRIKAGKIKSNGISVHHCSPCIKIIK